MRLHFQQQTVPSAKLMNSRPSAAIRPSKTGGTFMRTDDIITAADEAFESAMAVRAFGSPLGTIMSNDGTRRDDLTVVDYHEQARDLTTPFS